MTFSHDDQRKKWDKEHAEPFALKQMDARKVSSSIPPFFEFLRLKKLANLAGLEMGCGKGRNVIWCAEQPEVSTVTGFDFSSVAIEEAKRRAEEAGVSEKSEFLVMDATVQWKFEDDSFDFGMDCTASPDIETPEGRRFAVSEMRRVLKLGGHFLVYVMSTDDEYHKEMVQRSPAEEKNAFYHPETGKFEKVFDEAELDAMYADFELVEARRIDKKSVFFGKEYASKMHWRVYQKLK